MDAIERERLTARFIEIESKLAGLRIGRVVDGAPADVEFALLIEQDEIEFELGADYIERRDASADSGDVGFGDVVAPGNQDLPTTTA